MLLSVRGKDADPRQRRTPVGLLTFLNALRARAPSLQQTQTLERRTQNLGAEGTYVVYRRCSLNGKSEKRGRCTSLPRPPHLSEKSK